VINLVIKQTVTVFSTPKITKHEFVVMLYG